MFSKSKSGLETFSYNSRNFHSTYSPEKEAERFVSLTNFDLSTEIIFIIEPGLSYSYKYFKSKYPNAKIGIIRIISELDSSDWDFKIDFEDFSDIYLLNHFSYNQLLNSQVSCWPVSEKLFSESVQSIYLNFTNSLKQAKTIAVTSQYFEKKWLKNGFNFIKYLNNYVTVENQKNDFPIFITASGPSLEYCVNEIKTIRNKIFLIALSSSVTFLIQNNIQPDLVLSTDGGYWAGQHLKRLKNINCPIAIPSEAFIQKDFLQEKSILPLTYTDGFASELLNSCKIPNFLIERNGTVSGSALKLAETLTSGPIYFAGLDLACNKSFQHSQPNELELNNACKYNKISNLEKKSAISSFGNESLKIYRTWFENQKIKNPTYRIIESGIQKQLGLISDISKNDLTIQFENRKEIQNLNIFSINFIISEKQKCENHKILQDFIDKNQNSEKFLKQLFPLDYISLNHCKSDNEKQIIFNRIQKNAEEIISKLRKILDD